MSNLTPNVFLLNLRIGENMPGGITCTLNLGVSPRTQSVEGGSVVFQATNPVTLVKSLVTGEYNYLCTMDNCHIMIVLDGFSIKGENGNLKNFNARILLSDDWSKGTANYSYLKDGKWVKVKNQPVTAIGRDEINTVKELAETANTH